MTSNSLDIYGLMSPPEIGVQIAAANPLPVRSARQVEIFRVGFDTGVCQW